ncbi:thiamine phosphate synthase [Sphingomonas sp. SUN019]|uniref:thiamine phosphate synthase n=1 Tax=Sphingomonas sp. SUN019 TaxID=2937788 RepID=UPI002164F02A|nr:thiamine phosphate synthase [Sphingomonas sp. SUN019]UVO50992.1 thiamine phosphate synthase [Sphingomonas sp. SUN019]
MRRRHPVPTLWLMTDERLGDGLWAAIERLPRGAGIVFRHYATPEPERRRMFAKVARIARARGLVVVRAGAAPMRGEMGTHNRSRRGILTFSVHCRSEAVAARRLGADVLFVSPMFATRSHKDARMLSNVRAMLIVREVPGALIALGGMDARRFRRLRGFDGWAAIDAWTR